MAKLIDEQGGELVTTTVFKHYASVITQNRPMKVT
jgi:hypothetical protein